MLYLTFGGGFLCTCYINIKLFNNPGSLAHKHKIVIAGNHDLTFDTEYKTAPAVLFGYKNENIAEYLREKGLDKVSDMLTDCTYLEDSEAVVAGIRIYGSPW